MKITLSINEIADYLYRYEDSGFSRTGAQALAEYLDQYEHEDAEFHVQDTVGDWSEYRSLVDYADDTFATNWRDDLDITSDMDYEEIDEHRDDYIKRNIDGTVLEKDGIFIISN